MPLPLGCIIPIFEDTEEQVSVTTMCDINYESGQKAGRNLSQYFFQSHQLVSLSLDGEFQLRPDSRSKFLSMPTDQKLGEIKTINSLTAKNMRLKMYCYLSSMSYNMYEAEDICYKRGLIITIRRYLSLYLKSVGAFFGIN